MKRYVYALAIALFLVSVTFFSPPMALAELSASELEERVWQMEEELRMLRKELIRVQQEKETEAVQKPERQIEPPAPMQQTEQPAPQIKQLEKRLVRVEKDNDMLFFRGGYIHLNHARNNQAFTDLFELGGISNDADEGWYVGAGFDFFLSDDVWSLISDTSVFAELAIEFKRLTSEDRDAFRIVPATPLNLSNSNAPPLGGNTEINTRAADHLRGVTVTMLTVSASPKLKYTGWGKFQPWIIPAGLAFHVISPPSDASTVLDIGVQFGAGLDYELIQGFHLGIDSRYHLTADETDGVRNDHWTAGGYMGIHF